MPEEKNPFLEELEAENEEAIDIFGDEQQEAQPEEESEETSEEEETEEESAMKLKNRREKRLAQKLQDERESNIALNARLAALAESSAARGEGEETLKSIERIYGVDSPEAIEATNILKDALKGIRDEAKEAALEAFREEKRQEEEALKAEEQELDSIIEDIEDTYTVDLSSAKGKATRTGFLKLLERMSPKDEEGYIKYYADPTAVWEEYQAKSTKKNNSRAKDLSSRTMVRSGASQETKIQNSAQERFLKENGII